MCVSFYDPKSTVDYLNDTKNAPVVQQILHNKPSAKSMLIIEADILSMEEWLDHEPWLNSKSRNYRSAVFGW